MLEVGLGGRLDAVNAFDADCAVVVSVDLDHMDYLGGDREAIGYEKAGIFRAGRPAICADPDAARVAHDPCARRSARSWLAIGTDFGYERRGEQWRYWGPRGKRNALPHPALRGAVQLGNAAAAITALDTLRERLPVAASDVRSGLLQAEIAGPLPGAAGPAGGDPRRRAQSACRARAGGEPRAASSAAGARSPCSRC